MEQMVGVKALGRCVSCTAGHHDECDAVGSALRCECCIDATTRSPARRLADALKVSATPTNNNQGDAVMATTTKAAPAKATPRKRTARPAAAKATKKAAAKKVAAPVEAAAPKAETPKAVEPKAEPVVAEVPNVEGFATIGIEPARPIVFGAVSDSLDRMPEGSKSYQSDGHLFVADGEGQAVVDAITNFMRAIVKENRSAGMYREGKLRGVRAAVLAAIPGTANTARAASKSGGAKSSSSPKVSTITAMNVERQAIKDWTAGGEQGDRPATPLIDAIHAEYAAKEAKKEADRAAKAAKNVTPILKAVK